jgi:cytochrome c peroxidase
MFRRFELLVAAAAVVLAPSHHVRTTLAAEPVPRAAVAPPSPMPPRFLRTLAHNPAGYDPQHAEVATDLLLGDLLFHSPALLGAKAEAMGLSCHTCHPNGSTHPTLMLPGLSDRPGNVDLSTGHFRKGAENGIADFVNIPSLRGARFTAPYGHDGRTASLAEFIQGVVAGEFGGAPLAPARLSALVRYVQDFDFLPNPNLDARGRLVPEKSSTMAKRGEALFQRPFAAMSGQSCASCHVPDRFFRDGAVHRMGSGRSPSPYGVDEAYETPTLLGTRETAPYFHDGRFATLADVVSWFDSFYGLKLKESERADLTLYLELVGAAEKRADERSMAVVMSDTFAYLLLLTEPDAGDDRDIWRCAVDACLGALADRKIPSAIESRVARAKTRLDSIRRRAEKDPLAPMRAEVSDLHRELVRLAADWTGALAAERHD